MKSDPMKKAMIQMQGIFAELDKSLLVKKLRLASERKRHEAKVASAKVGRATLRYPEVIQEIKRLRRKPKGGKPKTYREVAEELNRQGFKSRTKKPLTGHIVQNILQ